MPRVKSGALERVLRNVLRPLLVLRRHRGLPILVLYAALELRAFLRFQALNIRLASWRTPLSLAFPRAEWRRFFSKSLCAEALKRPTDLRVSVEKLFWARPLHDITRAAIEKWLRMYLSTCEDEERPALADEARELDEEAARLCGVLEGAFGHQFQEGGEQEFVRINSSATNHSPASPLFQLLPVRLGKMCLRVAARAIFRRVGCSWHRDESTGMEYWCRRGQGAGLIFFHGVGCGLSPYALLAWDLAKHYTGPLILAEMPVAGCAPRGTGTPVPRAEEIASSVERMKAKLGIGILHGCGHSLGGMVLSAIQKYKPDMFSRIVYIESPVFFFRYSEGFPIVCKEHSVVSIISQFCCCKFRDAAMDLFLSDPLQQHGIHHGAWFMEACDFEKHLDERILVILGEEDRLCSVKTKDWLATEHPRVTVEIYCGRHGDILLPPHSRWASQKIALFLDNTEVLEIA